MNIKSSDLVSLFEKTLRGIECESFEETGVVITVGDGICYVHGLINAVFGELIEFEGVIKALL